MPSLFSQFVPKRSSSEKARSASGSFVGAVLRDWLTRSAAAWTAPRTGSLAALPCGGALLAAHGGNERHACRADAASRRPARRSGRRPAAPSSTASERSRLGSRFVFNCDRRRRLGIAAAGAGLLARAWRFAAAALRSVASLRTCASSSRTAIHVPPSLRAIAACASSRSQSPRSACRRSSPTTEQR